VSPLRMDCVYCGMLKGTSWAEATLNSEKINPVPLVIVGLKASVSQSANQAVS